jgi:HPr kinase/phosphorylase
MYLVENFYQQHGQELGLELVVGYKGLSRKILKPEIHRPGLSLSGYMKNFPSFRILLFGRSEMEYLKQIEQKIRIQRLESIFTDQTPLVIIARRYRPSKELRDICEKRDIPLFRSPLRTVDLLSKMIWILNAAFAPSTTLHGTLVEVFGVGVLLQGESSIGKSEAALGLIERGHRLISDDVVQVLKREEKTLVGSGPELTRHLVEIRGIGIINVAHLYGAVCVKHDQKIDFVIKMEEWNDNHFYDRIGLDEKFCEILNIRLPFYLLPLKPGRDVILLIETITLNHRLKNMGYNSAKEFNKKLLHAITEKRKSKKSPLKTLVESLKG